MIVAGLQLDVAWLDPTENFRRATDLALEAAARGARIVALPEMFATGFTMDAERSVAEGPSTKDFMARLAASLSVWVIGGVVEGRAATPSNACALFSPDGNEAGSYAKTHPFSLTGEGEHYAAGNTVATFDVEGVRVTPLICYDLRFPEVFRPAAERTDLYIILANWPASRASAWRRLLAARAVENQAYVLGVNRVGEGDGVRYDGGSVLCDPLGDVLGGAGSAAAVVWGPVEAGRVAELRKRYGFLHDRRPDLYARLDGLS